MKKATAWWIGVLGVAAAGAWAGSAVPFFDGFEDYPAGTRFVPALNGWQASTSSVAVQADAVYADSRAVDLPASGALSNSLDAVGLDRLWTDQYVLPSLGREPLDAAPAETHVWLYFNTNGYVTVATDGGWDVCATDVYGAAAPRATGNWVRVSLHHDFAAQEAAILLNGRVLREGVPFLGANATRYNGFVYRNANDPSVAPTNAYLDNVLVTTNLPPGLDNAPDGDGDGLSDAEEIHRHGNTTHYHLPVVSVTLTTVGGPGGDGGTVAPSGTYHMTAWGQSTNVAMSADAAFVVSDVRTNGASVGNFTGRNTRSAAWLFSNIMADTAVVVEFTYTGTRHVPADYATIQAAVSAAQAGETVRVGAGVWSLAAPIVIDKPLVVRGATNAPATVVLQAPAAGVDRDCFQVRSSNVTIQGFRMVNASNDVDGVSDGWCNAAIMVGNNAGYDQMAVATVLAGVTNGLFSHNEIASCSSGVYLFQTTHCTARDTAFTGNATGVWANATGDARRNWWGSITGPSGAGPGSGDPVSANVLYAPWYSSPAREHLVHRVGVGEDLQAAFDGAADGDYVTVAAGTYAGDLLVGKSITLLGGAFTITGDLRFTVSGTLSVTQTVTCVNAQVDAGRSVVLNSGEVVCDALVIQAGGSLVVNNGHLVVNGLDLSGTFTLDDAWGESQLAKLLRFDDNFERYGEATRVNRLGYFGWGATDSEVVVQSAEAFGGSARAMRMPMETIVSNRVATASRKVWSDCRVIAPLGAAPDVAPGADTSLWLHFNAAGYMAIATNGGWDVCLKDAYDRDAARVSNAWVRVTLFHDYDQRTAAFFLDGRLLRKEVPFLGGTASAFRHLVCVNQSGSSMAQPDAYVDNVVVDTDPPADLVAEGYGDGDGDGMPDAMEIHLFGNLLYTPVRGMMIRFR